MRNYINKDELNELLNSEHRDPHHILGIHSNGSDNYYINVLQPCAKAIDILDIDNDIKYSMEKIREEGFFTVEVPNNINYKLLITGYTNNNWEMYDPYAFKPVLTDLDLYLFGQGTHYDIYNKLGAHPMEIDGIEGVHFAVWAPNAKRVSVIGDFSNWDGRT